MNNKIKYQSVAIFLHWVLLLVILELHFPGCTYILLLNEYFQCKAFFVCLFFLLVVAYLYSVLLVLALLSQAIIDLLKLQWPLLNGRWQSAAVLSTHGISEKKRHGQDWGGKYETNNCELGSLTRCNTNQSQL